MGWFEDRYDYEIKNNPICYLVYYYKGKILVRKGKTIGRTFHRFGDDNRLISCPWNVGIPLCYNEVNSKGKVLVKDEKDIPYAKKLIKEHIIKRRSALIDSSYNTINNMTLFLEGEV